MKSILIFNQIKDGQIAAEININFIDKTVSEFVFDVNAKIRDAKLNILNEHKIEEIHIEKDELVVMIQEKQSLGEENPSGSN